METKRTIKDIEKRNIVDTLSVFCYYIKDKTMFYELIDQFGGLETYTGDEVIVKLVRVFGGMTIKVPSYTEILVYKWLINNSDKLAMSNMDVHEIYLACEHDIKHMVNTPDVDFIGIIQKFMAIVKPVAKELAVFNEQRNNSGRLDLNVR